MDCENLNCPFRSPLRRILRRGKNEGVLLQGRWYCCLDCFEDAITGVFNGLLKLSDEPLPRLHRVPLGLLLLGRGVITDSQLKSALQAQRDSGSGRLGRWLIRLGVASAQDVSAALASQWGCGVFPLERDQRYRECSQMLPFALLESSHMIPVHYLPSQPVALCSVLRRYRPHRPLCRRKAHWRTYRALHRNGSGHGARLGRNTECFAARGNRIRNALGRTRNGSHSAGLCCQAQRRRAHTGPAAPFPMGPIAGVGTLVGSSVQAACWKNCGECSHVSLGITTTLTKYLYSGKLDAFFGHGAHGVSCSARRQKSVVPTPGADAALARQQSNRHCQLGA